MAEAAERHLRRALTLAARGRYTAAPNPRVGAVVVAGERVVGEGWHRRPGEPHAEVLALAAAGEAARGATLYVNLEPCAHHGRTPPCTEAILAAGVRRVVACHRDPNPHVAGGGFERLEAAGLEVRSGLLIERALTLNLPFLVSALLERPAVTLKWAMSLDGKIATATGESQWISSPPARRWALDLRDEHDAILVGSATALADDPRLTRRAPARPGPTRPRSGRPITRVVLDRRLRLPPAARMLAEPGAVLVYTRSPAEAERRRALEAAGATVVEHTDPTPGAVLADLAGRGVQSLLIEGGGEVLAAFVEAGLYERVAAVVAPRLLGGHRAPGPLGGEGVAGLAAAPRLEGLESRRRGQDLILTGMRQGCLRELSSSVAG